MAVITYSDDLDRIIRLVSANKDLNHGIALFEERRDEFASAATMMLAGIGVVPEARRMVDDELDQLWSTTGTRNDEFDAEEVIIGGGLHAAIYCAARVRAGCAKPLVLERRGTAGGTFALSRRPSFCLNSRNRPGPLGLTGEGLALNYLPGASIQPADLSGREYQTNADLAWVIRVTLAEFARVLVDADVRAVNYDSGPRRYRVILDDGAEITCDRVLDARGTGEARDQDIADGSTILTFPEFLQRMDRPFPLRGMRRVAVIGDGDSARVTVEALFGIGPSAHMSTASLDFVETVDWYAPNRPTTASDWRAAERGRYLSIAAFLTQPAVGRARLKIVNNRGAVSTGFAGAYVNERQYDCAILATGFTRKTMGGLFALSDGPYGSSPEVARQFGNEQLFAIGPIANLQITSAERRRSESTIAENRDAIFRYANRTAALARRLPGEAPF